MRRFVCLPILLLALCGEALAVEAVPVDRPSVMSVAPATPSLTVRVRAGQHADFERVVFDWPRPTAYTIEKHDQKVRIVFEGVANILFDARVLPKFRRMSGFSAQNISDKTIVSFQSAPDVTLSDFTSGASVAVDARGGRNAPPPPPQHTAQSDGANLPSNKNDERGGAVALSETASDTSLQQDKKSKPHEPALPKASTSMPVARQSLMPAGDHEKTTGVSVPGQEETFSSEKKSEQSAVDGAVPQENNSMGQSLGAAFENPEHTHGVSVHETIEDPAVPVVDRQEQDGSRVNVQTPVVLNEISPYSAELSGQLNVEPKLVLTLDPKLPLRAAVYVRARYAYIVFEKKITLPLDQLLATGTSSLVKLEPLDLVNGSGYRFPIGQHDRVDAKLDGHIWQIYLSRAKDGLPIGTSLVAQPNFALGARFILPMLDSPEVVKLTDPVVGDIVFVVPLGKNLGFAVERRMADFVMLPASVGMVIKPLTDKVVVRPVSEGIEVTAEGGLRLSPASETGSDLQMEHKAKSKVDSKSLYDFATWRGKASEAYTRTRQRLQQTIVDVPEADRNRARLELARFYFAWGHGAEAVGLLRYIAAQVPDLMSHADFMALLGASEVLAAHSDDALKLLESPVLETVSEVKLWRAVAYADQRRWQDALDHFIASEAYLQVYPEPFYSNFMVLAIEAALALKKHTVAADWLDRLEGNGKSERTVPAKSYLRGVLHAEAGRGEAAGEEWQRAASGHDRLYKIRAELALIDLGVATQSTTVMQAIDRLEAMRFAWRGDDLEVDILHRLGQFYIQAKNVKAGMGTLSHALQLYPDSPLSPTINAEMAAAFNDVFLGSLGQGMSPLDALAIYQKYRSYAPKGDGGNQVMRNLAERLVAVDLLDQAAVLLTDLMEQRLQGQPKCVVANRLAAIHLLNHQSEKSLAVLDATQADAAPYADLTAERGVLRAKALSDLKRDEEALNLIKSLDTQAARLLRADIAMHGQMWDAAAKALLELVGTPPRAGQQLKPEQVSWLMSAAVAMANASDVDGLDKLAVNFGAAMSGTPEADTFRLLTKPDDVTNIKDIAAAQSQLSGVDMFQSFLNTYRTTPMVEKSTTKSPVLPDPAVGGDGKDGEPVPASSHTVEP